MVIRLSGFPAFVQQILQTGALLSVAFVGFFCILGELEYFTGSIVFSGA
jgi:hypothetical protein